MEKVNMEYKCNTLEKFRLNYMYQDVPDDTAPLRQLPKDTRQQSYTISLFRLTRLMLHPNDIS